MANDTHVLGAYILPGGVSDAGAAFEQARRAEELGLGTVWLSERWGSKDMPVLFGALSQTTSTIKLAAGAAHFQDRHPLVLASTCAALQSVTGGRFIFGVGKLTPSLWENAGLPPSTNRLLVDTVDIVRRLLRGEAVTYDGPVGKFHEIRLMAVPDVPPPPFLLTAIGPKTLEVAGRHFDGVLLHPFLTPEAVARSAELVRAAAAEAGREVRIYAVVIAAADLPREQQDRIVIGRAVTYLDNDPLGPAIFRANGWDEAPLRALRAHPSIVALEGGYADFGLTPEERVEVGRTVPEEWLLSAAAVGTAESSAQRLREFLDAGADELILHASTPDLLGPIVEAFAAAS